MPYAQKTTVSVEKSRAEIEAVLRRYGADQFMSGWDNAGKAVIGFRAQGRFVKFILEMPDRKDRQFTHKKGYGMRVANQAERLWEQACRQRWRALCLVVKAKLEAVQSGIAVFEDEFLAYVTMPNGQSVSQWLRPQLEIAYDSGAMPKSLLGLPDNTVDAK